MELIRKIVLKKDAKEILGKNGVLIAFIIIVITASIVYPEFLTLRNVSNILRQISMIGLMSLGITLVIISAGIDLSIGSIVAVGAIAAAFFSYNLFLSVTVPLAAGIILGSLNGLIITKLRIVPFIATLSTMMGIRGFAYLLTGIKTIPVNDGAKIFLSIGRGYVGIIPIPVLIYFIIFLVMFIVLSKTSFGRSIYAIGGNEEAARLLGLKVDRNKILCYTLSGMFSAMAGIVLCSRLGAGQPVSGKGWEMDVIASAAIGGTMLTGGVGSMGKTFIGVLIIGVINNIINLQGTLNSYWQSIITGSILLTVIIIQNLSIGKVKEVQKYEISDGC